MADSKVTESAGIAGKLLGIQRVLKVEKGQYNSFGGFKYRSKEDILEAVKPLAHDAGCVVTCDDEAQCLANGWTYVRTTATLRDCATGEEVAAHGLAREPEQKKGMDASQITGTASSYAGKRALGNLLALDDTADSDAPQRSEEPRRPPETGQFVARCHSCGTAYTFETRAQYDAFVAAPGCCPSPDWRVE
jgi:hypothetical protein